MMGFSISWIGVRGLAKQQILDALKLEDSQIPDEANESPISGAEIPGGWYILVLNRLDHPYVTGEEARLLSTGGESLVVLVEEHVMYSSAWMFCEGRGIWKVVHDSQRSIHHLETGGNLPAAYEAVKAEKQSDQAGENPDAPEVDHIFDVPIDLAEVLSGYRHDRAEFDWGEPEFTELRSKV